MKKQLVLFILAMVFMHGVMMASQESNTAALSEQLVLAGYMGDDKVAAQLIKAGANVNTADRHGSFPLSMAAAWGSDKIVAQLLAAGADVNKADRDGSTALSMAARGGRDKVVAQLLTAGADVNEAYQDGSTPLSIAAREGHDKVVAQLLAAGVRVSRQTLKKFPAIIILIKEESQKEEMQRVLFGERLVEDKEGQEQVIGGIFPSAGGHQIGLSNIIGNYIIALPENKYEMIDVFNKYQDEKRKLFLEKLAEENKTSSEGGDQSQDKEISKGLKDSERQRRANTPKQDASQESNSQEDKELKEFKEDDVTNKQGDLDVRKIANAVHFIVNEKSKGISDASISSFLESTSSSSGFYLNPDESLLAWKLYTQLSKEEKTFILNQSTRAGSNNVLNLVRDLLQKIVATEAAKGAKSQTLSTRMSNEPSEYEQAQEFGMSLEEYREQK
ncbi:MAG: ankyrin repeat domain-containing protein, partial [Candidatus Dependentiae bacterium]|nr:ankyrin repeat domain-containing protein [Candidatus Dependentiae bacterium]